MDTLKAKKCKACKKQFQPTRPLQNVCSIQCAIEHGKRKKVSRETKREKTLAELLKIAQQVFNQYIRLRDEKLPCISCGKTGEGVYHAGHYRSVGAHPELRFSEKNVHRQCNRCNLFLSGNLIDYRMGLVSRIGEATVKQLEGPHGQKKYTTDEVMRIISEYKQKIKEQKQNS